jgi:hypothetical protein
MSETETCAPASSTASIDGLWIALTDADADGDAERLAVIAWDLYARLGEATGHEARLRATVHDLACRAAAAERRARH